MSASASVRFAFERVTEAPPALFGVVVVAFPMTRALPGDLPADLTPGFPHPLSGGQTSRAGIARVTYLGKAAESAAAAA